MSSEQVIEVRFLSEAPGAASSTGRASRLSRDDWSSIMYLYILSNSYINKYYIGITSNLNNRIKEHNKKSNRGFTGKKGYWILVFSKYFPTKIEALKEELRLKKAKNNKYLEWYIEQNRAASSIGRASLS